MNRKWLWAIGVCLVLILVSQIEMIRYGIMQGRGQLRVLREAQPIEEILIDKEVPDSLKLKIEMIGEIKAFAQKNGLKQTDNYTQLFDQKGQDILWNVSACEPFSFKNYEWSFPFVGTFSYKGFFDLDKAKEERDELKAQGLDTRIRPVSAWSTLGWFNDPIMSNMLFKSEGQLAETIIHELTHGTIFIKDQLEFNENLASFIGREGALSYLREKYGADSHEEQRYLQEEKDANRYRDHILNGKMKLDSLYSTFNDEMTDSIRKRQKLEAIELIVDHLDTIEFYDKRYHQIFNNQLPNNTYFMSYQRYYAAGDSLQTLFENQNRDLKMFVQSFD